MSAQGRYLRSQTACVPIAKVHGRCNGRLAATHRRNRAFTRSPRVNPDETRFAVLVSMQGYTFHHGDDAQQGWYLTTHESIVFGRCWQWGPPSILASQDGNPLLSTEPRTMHRRQSPTYCGFSQWYRANLDLLPAWPDGTAGTLSHGTRHGELPRIVFQPC